MYSDEEIESWYLGLPFEPIVRGRVASRPDSGKAVPVAIFSDEEIERLYLGLPAKAA